ncbi:MAG: (4Fe-4S)-binding protein [Prevotellaceae bacterium]|jgi:uncharacterized Fe-S cluster protein YjdI|nr:(4Fe-4S)-binding protein [Prevotellaceae bacterium]
MNQANLIKEYSNGEITVVWQSDLCFHAGNCARYLPQVFRPRERPWVRLEQASSAEIRTVVATCPSGALSIKEL